MKNMKRRNLNVRSRQVTNGLRSKRSGLTEGGDRRFLRNFYMQLQIYAAQKLARSRPKQNTDVFIIYLNAGPAFLAGSVVYWRETPWLGADAPVRRPDRRLVRLTELVHLLLGSELAAREVSVHV
jgi:hypothetical protein